MSQELKPGMDVSVELKGKIKASGHVAGQDHPSHVDVELEDGTTVCNVPTTELKVHVPKKSEEKEDKKK